MYDAVGVFLRGPTVVRNAPMCMGGLCGTQSLYTVQSSHMATARAISHSSGRAAAANVSVSSLDSCAVECAMRLGETVSFVQLVDTACSCFNRGEPSAVPVGDVDVTELLQDTEPADAGAQLHLVSAQLNLLLESVSAARLLRKALLFGPASELALDPSQSSSTAADAEGCLLQHAGVPLVAQHRNGTVHCFVGSALEDVAMDVVRRAAVRS